MKWLLVLLMASICSAYSVTYDINYCDSNKPPNEPNSVTWIVDSNNRYLMTNEHGWASYDGKVHRSYYRGTGLQDIKPIRPNWRPFDEIRGVAQFRYASCSRRKAMKLAPFVKGKTWVVNGEVWSRWWFDDLGRLSKFEDCKGENTITWTVLEWGKGYPKTFLLEVRPAGTTHIYTVTSYQENVVVPVRSFEKGTEVINKELGISYTIP